MPPDRAAWAVDLLLHFATSTAAEQGTRQQAIDADDEEDVLAAALRDAPAGTFPHIAALGAELHVRGRGRTAQPGVSSVLISGSCSSTPDPRTGKHRTQSPPGGDPPALSSHPSPPAA